jgi:cold shock protein
MQQGTGTIVRLNEKKFGFIKVDGQMQEKDLFFHANELVGVAWEDLREGDKVSFEIDTTGPKGPSAVKVQKA